MWLRFITFWASIFCRFDALALFLACLESMYRTVNSAFVDSYENPITLVTMDSCLRTVAMQSIYYNS